MVTPRGRETGTFDVAIVGAGVIGCALARKYALAGARIVVIEKAADILDGASKANKRGNSMAAWSPQWTTLTTTVSETWPSALPGIG